MQVINGHWFMNALGRRATEAAAQILTSPELNEHDFYNEQFAAILDEVYDIDDDGIMPDYFSFEERDSVDHVKISAAFNSKDYTDEKKEEPIKFNHKAPGVIAGLKYCGNCGNKLPVDAKFCDKCGSRVDYRVNTSVSPRYFIVYFESRICE